MSIKDKTVRNVPATSLHGCVSKARDIFVEQMDQRFFTKPPVRSMLLSMRLNPTIVLEEMLKVKEVDFMRAAFDAELLSIAKFRGNLSSKQQDMPAAAMCLSSHGKNVNC